MDINSLRQHLIDIDYPNIHILKDEPVSDIVGSKNRIMLTSWIVQQMGIDDLPILKSDLEVVLSNIIYASGFCTLSEKTQFIKGDPSLNIEKQVSIIKRMFQYVKAIRNIKSRHHTKESPKTHDCEDLAKVINRDINLFPMLGPIKEMPLAEREARMKKYKDSIDLVKSDIERCKSLLQEQNTKIEIFDDKEPNFDDLKRSIIDFQEMEKELKKSVDRTSSGPTFSSDFFKASTDCKDQINLLSQYLNDIHVIEEYKGYKYNLGISSGDKHEMHDIIGKISNTSTELINCINE